MKPVQYLFKSIFIVLMLTSVDAEAQLENKIFRQDDSLYAKDTQSVYLQVELLNYLRNTEYFDIIEKGQTLFGSALQVNLQYQVYKNIVLKAGIQTRQDYGSTGFVAVQPALCLTLYKHKWRHNFGMLQGSTNYGFIEPMYNIDRAITHRIENGIQSIYTGKTLKHINFLVWNEPTYRTTFNQERFTTGFTSEKTLHKKNGWFLSFPLQGTLAHRGGQLNSNPNPIYTRINVSAGLKLNYQFESGLKIRTENYWLGSGDFSPTITQPYKNGAASWHTLSFQYKGWELMGHYWAGREYQSPVGTAIYNNYNLYDNYEHRQVRHMVMTRLMYAQQLNQNTAFDFRFEPFYDVEYGQIQYSYSVYLKLNLNKNLFTL